MPVEGHYGDATIAQEEREGDETYLEGQGSHFARQPIHGVSRFIWYIIVLYHGHPYNEESETKNLLLRY